MYNFQGEADDGKDKYDAVCIFHTETMLLLSIYLYSLYIFYLENISNQLNYIYLEWSYISNYLEQ
jgi:hypothetical protein